MLTLSTHLLQREGGDKKKSMSRSKIFVAVAGVASVAACLGLTATVSFPSRTVLSPVYTANTKPDLAWNGLPEKYQGNPVFEDMDHTDDHYTKDNKDPFGPKGQYGMWMNIQGDTINSFGCGPKGPMECFTGTTPGQHWANRETRGRMLPKMKVAQGTRLAGNAGWNGLVTPGIPFDENSDEKVTPDPFNMNGQYGYYMGIQDGTRFPGASWGCGPGGPNDCSVGTTPGQHWARVAPSVTPQQRQMQVIDIPEAEAAKLGLLAV